MSKYKSISKTCEKNYIRVEMIKETINDPMLSFSAAGIMTFILRVFVFLPGEILSWQIFHELSLWIKMKKQMKMFFIIYFTM